VLKFVLFIWQLPMRISLIHSHGYKIHAVMANEKYACHLSITIDRQ